MFPADNKPVEKAVGRTEPRAMEIERAARISEIHGLPELAKLGPAYKTTFSTGC